MMRSAEVATGPQASVLGKICEVLFFPPAWKGVVALGWV